MTAAWDLPDFDDHEAVHLFRDGPSGLTAIVAIHSTHLGPSAGGTRFWHYPDKQAAITDALRLSRGMSYKNAMAGLPMGGGKAVILADSAGTKSAAMMRSRKDRSWVTYTPIHCSSRPSTVRTIARRASSVRPLSAPIGEGAATDATSAPARTKPAKRIGASIGRLASGVRM